jgi:hypothetical protein
MKKLFLLFICLHAHAMQLHNATSKKLDLLKIVFVFHGSNPESTITLAPKQVLAISGGPFHIYKNTERANELSYIGRIQSGATYDIVEDEHGTLKIKEKI